MPLLNQTNPPFTESDKIEFQNNMIIKSGYIPMIYVILIKYGYIINNNRIELIHKNGIYEKWKNQNETKIVIAHIRRSIIDIYNGILIDNNNNNILNCINCILQIDNQPLVLQGLPNQTLYIQQQIQQVQVLPEQQYQQCQYQQKQKQQKQYQQKQRIYQPFPIYQQYNPPPILPTIPIQQYPPILSFYEGNIKFNGMLVGEYHQLFNTVKLQQIDFFKDMFFYFPILNQPNPSFREVDKLKIQNDDVLKSSYVNMVKVVLSKYGYTVIQEPLEYGKIMTIYDEWRYKEETIRVLNQIKGSVISIFGRDDLVQIIDKILCDNNPTVRYLAYGNKGNQNIHLNNPNNDRCICTIM